MDYDELSKDMDKIYEIKEKVIRHIQIKLGCETYPRDIIQNTKDVIDLLMYLQHYSFKRLVDREMIGEGTKWI